MTDEGGGELTIDPEKGLVTIAPDGSVSQEGELVGKVGVVAFDDLSILEKTGDNLLKNTSNLQPHAADGVKVAAGSSRVWGPGPHRGAE